MAIKTDYKYDIYRFIPRNIQYIAKNIYDKVISGKKIYGMITSKTYGFMIMKYL